ncbi:MAG TPA: sugar porter family MFS transporter [Solirubrobacteraceae bacterium]
MADAQQVTPTSSFTGRLGMAAAVSAISALLYGYDTGIISGALLQIEDDFDIGSAMKQIIAASILLGAVIGALVCSRVSEQRGRRGTILVLAVIFTLGAILCALAPTATTLSLGRIFLGFAVGGGTQTIPMYVAELAPAPLRGRLVLTFQVGIGVGIVLSTLVGASEAVDWRVAIGAASVPAAIMFVLMLRLPESPRWLVKQNRTDDARDVLTQIRAEGHDIEGEVEEIVDVEQREREAATSGWDGLRKPWVRPALIVGCGIAIATQLSGIEMIVYYAPTILTDNGFSDTAALRVSVALGVTYLVMMLVGLSIVDRVGRRRLTLGMIPGAALALFALGAIFAFGLDKPSTLWLIIACLIVFMFFNAGGLQLMGWLTGAEIYPLAVRGAGTSAQSAVLWTTNLLITLTLLTMIDGIGVGPTLWVYALFNVGAWIFVWKRMPELTGRSLEQIECKLREGHFRPADFENLPETARTRPAASRPAPAQG